MGLNWNHDLGLIKSQYIYIHIAHSYYGIFNWSKSHFKWTRVMATFQNSRFQRLSLLWAFSIESFTSFIISESSSSYFDYKDYKTAPQWEHQEKWEVGEIVNPLWQLSSCCAHWLMPICWKAACLLLAKSGANRRHFVRCFSNLLWNGWVALGWITRVGFKNTTG